MSLYDQLKSTMQDALKDGRRDTVRTLRTLLAKLKEGAIAKGETLSEAEEIKVIQSAAKQRREAIEMYEKGGRDDLVQSEETELEVIEAYLPNQLSGSELEAIVTSIIEETGATSMQDMGKVMPAVMRKVAGQADGKQVQLMVRQKLNE
ncbi:MAG: GatB/YqeY domain-containing protein [Candidatus Marinimicrobia bacterium]|nr:GatB/YqeY domain-containing protein [Candidatus Neomarinimicrobiota bacterium]MDP6837261.1 GatB/YqeY domain-containing protein [Candidatus Neomarinimicrobiota bacterium]